MYVVYRQEFEIEVKLKMNLYIKIKELFFFFLRMSKLFKLFFKFELIVDILNECNIDI